MPGAGRHNVVLRRGRYSPATARIGSRGDAGAEFASLTQVRYLPVAYRPYSPQAPQTHALRDEGTRP